MRNYHFKLSQHCIIHALSFRIFFFLLRLVSFKTDLIICERCYWYSRVGSIRSQGENEYRAAAEAAERVVSVCVSFVGKWLVEVAAAFNHIYHFDFISAIIAIP